MRLWARSLWAISRPFPSEQFLEVWDFRVEACITQDGDHFVFGDFVIVVATFVDGLDDCVELFLRDHGLHSCSKMAHDHHFASKIHSRIIAEARPRSAEPHRVSAKIIVLRRAKQYAPAPPARGFFSARFYSVGSPEQQCRRPRGTSDIAFVPKPCVPFPTRHRQRR